MPYEKRVRKLMLFALLAIGMSLSGCAETPKGAPIVVKKNYTGCRAFGKATWSVDDTAATANAIRRHNAAYARLCGK